MPDERQARAERVHAWEERAAIIEYVGGFVRADAEDMATRELGLRSSLTGDVLRMIDAGRTS